MAVIALLGTMDTKGDEYAFIADLIQKRGHQPLVIDVGILEPPRIKPDVTREMVNLSTGPVTVLLPLRALSVISAPGQKVHDPAADRALFEAIKLDLRSDIPLIEMDCEINDPAFAATCASELLANIERKRGGQNAHC